MDGEAADAHTTTIGEAGEQQRERDRLTVPQGLAALSLDALASVAYGP